MPLWAKLALLAIGSLVVLVIVIAAFFTDYSK